VSYQPDHYARHQCLVCGKTNARITKSGWGSGSMVETECPDCKSTGVIGNIEPWYGDELPIVKLRGMFTVAEIPIIGEPLKLQNRYWQGHDKKFYHPWWFVQTSRGWIEIGYRKRVMSIDWRHTDIRHVVTKDDLTKGDDHVHAYTDAKAIEYLTELWRFAAKKETHEQPS
jgi:hypothetical protein